jgi:hypothetical protein
MAQAKINSLPIFENSNITGDFLEGLVIAAADETTHAGRPISYDIIGRSTGIIGLAVETSGNASDLMTIVAQFHYGIGTTYTTKTITITSSHACNTNNFYRLDINSSWRNIIPFMKMKFTFTKTGTNASCTVKSRLVLY